MVKNNQKSKLNNKQREAIHLLVHTTQTQKSIAHEIDVKDETLSRWINNNEEFKKAYDEELETLKAYRQRIFKVKAQKAVNKLVELMNAENENVQLASAKEILDRAGDKVDDNVNINVDIERSNNLINSIAEQVGIGVGKDE